MFRKYDIRSTDLNEDHAISIGWAIASFFGKTSYYKENTVGYINNLPTIIVARDIRHNSESLAGALIQGLRRNANVIDIGITTTPAMYFAVQELQATAGVIVTASHNPKEYNGFKIRRYNHPIGPAELSAIKNLTFSASSDFVIKQKPLGELSKYDINKMYAFELSQRFKHLENNQSVVVVDGANSVGGKLFCMVLDALKIKYYKINCEYDPNFSCHPPDPSKRENLQQLQDEVMATNADIGFSFDGDADRLGVVDKFYNTVIEDELIWLVACANLNKYSIGIEKLIQQLNSNSCKEPNNSIVLDIKTSDFLWNTIKRKLNSKVYIYKTGYPNIQRKMIETNAYMGAELSGHFAFSSWGGHDDAFYAALSILTIEPMYTKILSKYPQTYKIDELRIHVPQKHINEIIKLIYRKYRSIPKITIDGRRFYDNKNGWWLLVRKSNTEPVISIRAEAKTQYKLDAIVGTVVDVINAFLDRN